MWGGNAPIHSALRGRWTPLIPEGTASRRVKDAVDGKRNCGTQPILGKTWPMKKKLKQHVSQKKNQKFSGCTCIRLLSSLPPPPWVSQARSQIHHETTFGWLINTSTHQHIVEFGEKKTEKLSWAAHSGDRRGGKRKPDGGNQPPPTGFWDSCSPLGTAPGSQRPCQQRFLTLVFLRTLGLSRRREKVLAGPPQGWGAEEAVGRWHPTRGGKGQIQQGLNF